MLKHDAESAYARLGTDQNLFKPDLNNMHFHMFELQWTITEWANIGLRQTRLCLITLTGWTSMAFESMALIKTLHGLVLKLKFVSKYNIKMTNLVLHIYTYMCMYVQVWAWNKRQVFIYPLQVKGMSWTPIFSSFWQSMNTSVGKLLDSAHPHVQAAECMVHGPQCTIRAAYACRMCSSCARDEVHSPFGTIFWAGLGVSRVLNAADAILTIFSLFGVLNAVLDSVKWRDGPGV